MRLVFVFFTVLSCFHCTACGKPQAVSLPDFVHIVAEEETTKEIDVRIEGPVGSFESQLIDWLNSERMRLRKIEMLDCEPFTLPHRRLQKFPQLLQIEIENSPGWTGEFSSKAEQLERVTVSGEFMQIEPNGIYNNDIRELRNRLGLKELSLISYGGEYQEMGFSDFESIKSLSARRLTLSAKFIAVKERRRLSFDSTFEDFNIFANIDAVDLRDLLDRSRPVNLTWSRPIGIAFKGNSSGTLGEIGDFTRLRSLRMTLFPEPPVDETLEKINLKPDFYKLKTEKSFSRNLAQAVELSSVSFAFVDLDESIWSVLEALPKLRRVFLERITLTEANIRQLLNNPSVDFLSLTGTELELSDELSNAIKTRLGSGFIHR